MPIDTPDAEDALPPATDGGDPPSAAAGDDGLPGNGFTEVRDWAVGRLGHHLRTPLSIVAASAELLQASDDLVGADRQRVATLVDAVHDLRDGVNHLVTACGWPAAGATEPIAIDDVITASVGLVEADIRDRHEVEVIAETASGATVVAHGDVLRWALATLLRQAARQAAPGGRVRAVVDVTQQDLVELRLVPEAGRGERSGTSSQVPPDPMAATALELLGRSWAEVREVPADGGMPAVSVVLPTVGGQVDPSVAAATPVDRVDVPDPVGPDHGLLVLVVEDDDVLRSFLERTLSADWRVVAVGSAEQALEAVREERPDLVVCDIMLPGVDGESLVHALQGLDDVGRIPLIVLTGRTDEQLRIRLLRDGADDYLTKPFALDELQIRMAKLAASHLDLEDLRAKAAEAETLVGQLQHALNSRIVIEQAKAFIASERGIDVDRAFDLLRRHARDRQANLHEVARAVVESRQPPPA